MSFIKVNQELCVKCGRCVNACSMCVLKMGETEPVIFQESCNGCGHCVAVCPNKAIDNMNAPLSEQTAIDDNIASAVTPEVMETIIKSRRSIRSFKQQSVEREKIEALLNITRYAPTGMNKQDVAYHVIDNPDTLSQIKDTYICWVKEKNTQGKAPISPRERACLETGRDVALWGAPCLVLALTPKSTFLGKTNADFTLGIANTFAPVIGLGVCLIGSLGACIASNYEPLVKLLDLPQNMDFAFAMVVGYPKDKYFRIVDRNLPNITWQQKKGEVK